MFTSGSRGHKRQNRDIDIDFSSVNSSSFSNVSLEFRLASFVGTITTETTYLTL